MRPASRIFTLSPSDGAQATRRHRTGIVPLPASVPELTPSADPALRGVNTFVDRLIELPLSSWLTIGSELMADREGLLVRQRAWSDVEAAISGAGLAVAAWYARDAVETAAYVVSRHTSRWSREERCRFAATQGAADAAALSLLAHAHIPTQTLRILCVPFAASIDSLLC